jgi:hypothetical protein
MDQNPIAMTLTTAGIATGAALLAPVVAPVAAPAMHGIAGIAIVGLGVYASGSAVMNATTFLNEKANELLKDGAAAAGLINNFIFTKPKPKVQPKEVPFKW